MVYGSEAGLKRLWLDRYQILLRVFHWVTPLFCKAERGIAKAGNKGRKGAPHSAVMRHRKGIQNRTKANLAPEVIWFRRHEYCFCYFYVLSSAATTDTAITTSATATTTTYYYCFLPLTYFPSFVFL